MHWRPEDDASTEVGDGRYGVAAGTVVTIYLRGATVGTGDAGVSPCGDRRHGTDASGDGRQVEGCGPDRLEGRCHCCRRFGGRACAVARDQGRQQGVRDRRESNDAAGMPAGAEPKFPPSNSEKKEVLEGKQALPKAWIPFVPFAFFLLLFISAAVGTGLRVLVAYQSNQLSRLTGFAVWIELVVALSVAFGLALFYLLGSISFTGHVSMLESNAQNFPTIAVSMSLLWADRRLSGSARQAA